MSGVYVVLAGPLHERIFGLTGAARNDDDTPVGRISNVAARSVVRMILVLAAFFSLDFLFHCVDQSMHSGKWGPLGIIVYEGIAPGVVSYYCSAALQAGAPSIRKRVLRPCFVLGATLLFPAFVCMALVQGASLPLGMLVFAVALAGVLNAVAFGALWFGLYALAAGSALDRARGPRRMAWLLLALLAAVIVVQAVTGGFLSWISDRLHTELDDIWPLKEIARPFFVLGGWAVGLYASGFPQLVERHLARGADVAVGATTTAGITADDVRELSP